MGPRRAVIAATVVQRTSGMRDSRGYDVHLHSILASVPRSFTVGNDRKGKDFDVSRKCYGYIEHHLDV